MRDYTLTSPSLDGILTHADISYGGLKRPVLLNRIFDKSYEGENIDLSNSENHKIIENYFYDIYGLIIKKLSEFVIEYNPEPDRSVKLVALIQELIKVKKILIVRKRY